MTSLEAYKSFLLKVNKNDTNKNIDISKGEFVLLYNEQSSIWLEKRIEESLNSDRINDIQELLETDTKLDKIEDVPLSSNFTLPQDFVRYSSSYSIASKDGCGPTVLYNWDVKNRNINNLYIDENEKPSFEYQDTFVRISENVFKVHRTDFTVDEAYLDYYKHPGIIDIEGYTKLDRTPSTTINPTISDQLANEIISFCALEVTRRYDQSDAFPLAKDRVQQIK